MNGGSCKHPTFLQQPLQLCQPARSSRAKLPEDGSGCRAGGSEWQELARGSPWGFGRNVWLLCCLQEAPERLLVPLPGEIYWNKPWPCSTDIESAPADAWRAHYCWAGLRALPLTLGVLLAAEPAGSSLLMMSWFPWTHLPLLITEVSECSSETFQPPLRKYLLASPCFLLFGTLMVEHKSLSQNSQKDWVGRDLQDNQVQPMP